MKKEVTERLEIIERQIELITEAIEKLTVIAEKLYDAIQRIRLRGNGDGGDCFG